MNEENTTKFIMENNLQTISSEIKPDNPIAVAESIIKGNVSNKKFANSRSKIPLKEIINTSNKINENLPLSAKRYSISRKSKTSLDILSEDDNQKKTKLSSRSYGLSTYDIQPLKNFNKHRPGEVPSYLKKNSKKLMEEKFTKDKNELLRQQTLLTTMQSDVLSLHRNLQEMQTKNNIGKSVKLPELELVAMIDNNDGELLIKSNSTSLKGFMNHFIIYNPTDCRNELPEYYNFRMKLQSIYFNCFNLYQELVDSFDKLATTKEGKQAGDCSDFGEDLLNILKRFEEKVVSLETKQVAFIDSCVQDVKNMVSNMSNECMNFPNNHVTEDQFNELSKELEEYKRKYNKLEEKYKEVERNHNNELVELKRFENILIDKQNEIIVKDEKADQLNFKLKKMEKSIDIKNKDIAKNVVTINKLEEEIKNLQQINIVNDSKEKNHKVMTSTYQKEHELRLSLESKLIEQAQIIDNLKNQYNNTISLEKETQLKDEIQFLTNQKNILNEEKLNLESENAELQKSLINTNAEKCTHQQSNNNKDISEPNRLIAKNKNLQEILVEKLAIIKNLEGKLQNYENAMDIDETNCVIGSETEKIREIEILKADLMKKNYVIKQQEETINMHQRLLRVRSELINSLQEKEVSVQCQMEHLHSELINKTNILETMNREICQKAEELSNIFSTLSSKQMELFRQEQIIKMLEENNVKAQILRAKKEERIAFLEIENSELKHKLRSH